MASRKNKENGKKKKKVLGVLLIILALMLFISIATHSAYDDRRIQELDNPFNINFVNQVGIVGAYSSNILIFFFGWISYFIPLLMTLISFSLLDLNFRRKLILPFWGICSVAILVTMLSNVYLLSSFEFALDHFNASGGFIFYNLTSLLTKVVGIGGSYLVLGGAVFIWLIVFILVYDLHKIVLDRPGRFGLDRLGTTIKGIPASITGWISGLLKKYRNNRQRRLEERFNIEAEAEDLSEEALEEESEGEDEIESDTTRKQKKKVTLRKKTVAKKAQIGQTTQDFNFPGLDILEDNPDGSTSVNPDELAFTARALKETLETFDITIEGQIEKLPGPIITRYEFKPAAGVKINKIVNLSDDLALALKAKRIRIVAPIPGKAAVGIEIPNRNAKLVYLKEIIVSDAYTDNLTLIKMGTIQVMMKNH